MGIAFSVENDSNCEPGFALSLEQCGKAVLVKARDKITGKSCYVLLLRPDQPLGRVYDLPEWLPIPKTPDGRVLVYPDRDSK